MTDSPKEPRIPLFTLGEMRMLGIKVPGHFRDSPDEDMLTVPRSAALQLISRRLKQWKVADEERNAFMADITLDVIRDVLVSHHLLQMLLRNADPEIFFLRSHKQFEDRTPWDLIRSGESKRIRRFLAHHVFCGGW